jgi:hypothetical protein
VYSGTSVLIDRSVKVAADVMFHSVYECLLTETTKFVENKSVEGSHKLTDIYQRKLEKIYFHAKRYDPGVLN